MPERVVETRSRKLRILETEGTVPPPRERFQPKPDWIRMKMPAGDAFFDLKQRVAELGLHTVCESASCPNIGECWNRRSLTIMILGGTCTRSCQFCDVPTGRPLPPDPDEPERVATMLAELGLRHTVVTCVDRDDLPDGGAAHWAATIRAVKARSPELVLEVLTGDFKGDTGAVDVVLAAAPDVFAHNLETVPRLSRQVRVQASYPRSYAVLGHAKRRGAITKTGLMLGLGEEPDEVREVMRELRDIGVDILTLGQYLRPSPKHLAVARFAHPDEFASLRDEALALGFPHVESGPMVRSSYHADGQRDIVLGLRGQRPQGPDDRVGASELRSRDPVAGGAGPSQGPDDRVGASELRSRDPVAGGAGPSQGPDDRVGASELRSRDPVAGGAGPSQGPDDRVGASELRSRDPVAGGAGPSQGPDDRVGASELRSRDPVAGGAGPSQGPDDRVGASELRSRDPVAGGAGPSQGPDDRVGASELRSRDPVAGGAGPSQGPE